MEGRCWCRGVSPLARTARPGPTPAPGVIPARSDAEHASHGVHGELGLICAHEPIDFPGRAPERTRMRLLPRSRAHRKTGGFLCAAGVAPPLPKESGVQESGATPASQPPPGVNPSYLVIRELDFQARTKRGLQSSASETAVAKCPWRPRHADAQSPTNLTLLRDRDTPTRHPRPAVQVCAG